MAPSARKAIHTAVKDDLAYLLHIRDAIVRVLEYTRDGEHAFPADTKTQDAVIRNTEIVGDEQDRKMGRVGYRQHGERVLRDLQLQPAERKALIEAVLSAACRH